MNKFLITLIFIACGLSGQTAPITAMIDGTIIATNKHPIADAEIRVVLPVSSEKPYAGAADRNQIVNSGFSDARGHFQIKDITPGTYTIWFIADGFVSIAHARIKLKANKMKSFSIKMTPYKEGG